MITADSEEDVRSIYDSAIKKSEEMGWQKAIDYSNDKFQELKKKLGVEYVNPNNLD